MSDTDKAPVDYLALVIVVFAAFAAGKSTGSPGYSSEAILPKVHAVAFTLVLLGIGMPSVFTIIGRKLPLYLALGYLLLVVFTVVTGFVM